MKDVTIEEIKFEYRKDIEKNIKLLINNGDIIQIMYTILKLSWDEEVDTSIYNNIDTFPFFLCDSIKGKNIERQYTCIYEMEPRCGQSWRF